MNKYILKMELKSETLFGSGEGFGATIDTDIVFDDLGIPYIPARRVKGLLNDSAQTLLEIFSQSNINLAVNSVETVFGKAGQSSSTPIYFSNLFIVDYKNNKEWLEYFINNYSSLISSNSILKYFTSIRHQIAVEKGVTKEHSLRTFRVLNSNLVFEGEILTDYNKEKINFLALACANLRNAGMMRNRGFGEVSCCLLDEKGRNITNDALKELEEVCIA